MEEFCSEFDSVLATFSTKNSNLFLLGDFNIDLLRAENHHGTSTFLDGLASYNLLPSITRPTRITTHSSTLIDNIFSNVWARISLSSIIASDISDHLPVLTSFELDSPIPKYFESNERRLINEEQNKIFLSRLSEMDWSPIYEACNSNNANLAYDLF